MVKRLNWSREAIEDLNSIGEYIAKDSIFYANSVVRKIFTTAKQIPGAVEIGRIVPEIGKIRERFVYSYRLVYKIDDEQVLIVAIIHGKRLMENIADRFN